MKIVYKQKELSSVASAIVDMANEIIDRYEAQGFNLTLRQLYYQFVSADAFPADWADKETGSTNNERSYKRLGDIISDARMAGLIDWHAIIDRTRSLKELATWDSPAEVVKACAQQFRVDMWENQNVRPEVWVEKDAAIGVVEGVCNELRVPFFSCRGYTSQSAMWEAAQRMLRRAPQRSLIIHLGDHDPSGIDMSRDVEERIRFFMGHHDLDAEQSLGFVRIGLNMDQVEQYQPPPNPTKVTDSRAAGYIRLFGHECWELDALEPTVVASLIRGAVESVRDDKKWKVLRKTEVNARASLDAVAAKWDIAAAAVGKKKP